MSAYRQQPPRGLYDRGGDEQWGRITTETRWGLRLLGYVVAVLLFPLWFVLLPIGVIFLDDPLYPPRPKETR